MAENLQDILRGDLYMEDVLLQKFDWRDKLVRSRIARFIWYGKKESELNIDRLDAIDTGKLKRSIYWHTWNDSGGDRQVFEAKYLYYEKFVELALGKNHKYVQIPAIQMKMWGPIRRPDNKPRLAKPFVTTEFRKQVRRFERYVLRHLSFVGEGYMIYAAGFTRENADAINRLLIAEKA